MQEYVLYVPYYLFLLRHSPGNFLTNKENDRSKLDSVLTRSHAVNAVEFEEVCELLNVIHFDLPFMSNPVN